jgi:AcrR family transcriptional regulator
MPRIIETSREEYREEAKKRIVNAAIKVMNKKGYQFMTVEDIAKEVGVTKAALYLYFENKEDLLNGVIAESAKIFDKIFVNYPDNSNDLDTALEKMISHIIKLQNTFGTIDDNIALISELVSLTARDPEKYSIFFKTFQKNVVILENGLREIQRKMLIPDDPDPHGTAMAVVALIGAVKFRIFLGEDEDEVKKWWVLSVKKLLAAPVKK